MLQTQLTDFTNAVKQVISNTDYESTIADLRSETSDQTHQEQDNTELASKVYKAKADHL